MSGTLAIDWAGERLVLCPDSAVYWPKEKTLFVADPHFGKAAAFRRLGLAVPEMGTEHDCQRLETLLTDTDSRRLVILGDFLHSLSGRTDPVRRSLGAWRTRNATVGIHLVRGNHDVHAGDPWPELEIECHSEPWAVGPWQCRHEPSATGGFVLAGHVHPSISVAGRRASCFWRSERQLILPAFGSFTGTHSVSPERGDEIFATDGTEVIKIPI